MLRLHGGALTRGEIGRVQSATLRLQPPDASRHVLVNLDLLGRCKSPHTGLFHGQHEAERAIQAAAEKQT